MCIKFGAQRDMKRLLVRSQQSILSYELYKELAGEICSPINDKEMTLQLRFELYQSKLIYLYNINDQCFKSINAKCEDNCYDYTQADLLNIQNAIEITREFLKQTIRESLVISLLAAEKKALYATRLQKNT